MRLTILRSLGKTSILNTPLCSSVLSVVNSFVKISPQRAQRYTEVSFLEVPS
jgi:hypothetical protein